MCVGIAKPYKYFQVICLQIMPLTPSHESKITNANKYKFFLRKFILLVFQPDGVKIINNRNFVKANHAHYMHLLLNRLAGYSILKDIDYIRP